MTRIETMAHSQPPSQQSDGNRRGSHVWRRCPICDGQADRVVFPYGASFSSQDFKYLGCASCGSCFVDPVPAPEVFKKMYKKECYHDQHYVTKDRSRYLESASLLRQHLPHAARVLDYGCGVGTFLSALRAEGLDPTGVEFDEAAAKYAATVTEEYVLSVEEFVKNKTTPLFDAVHFGDVLEHLPDPRSTLVAVAKVLKPGGLIFAEGPLENNPSPVYWAAKSFGFIKRRILGAPLGCDPPTHLIRVNARQQRLFFDRTHRLELLHWDVHESGWPYANGGAAKRAIAASARALGGKRIFGAAFGNRFRIIYRIVETQGTAPSTFDATAP